jgi:hypothetical protein
VKELYVFCEGTTEQRFCKQLLEPHLFPGHDGLIHPIAIEHSKHHGRATRGGVPGRYGTMRRDILNQLKGRRQQNVLFTTQIDLHGLPKDFPGKKTHRRNPDDPIPYVAALEKAFEDDIGNPRFIAHLQLYEYETMLFADPEMFQFAFDDCWRAIEGLKKIAASFPTIEHIDDGPASAPSKRIIDLIPAYGDLKATAGPRIAADIGLPVIRSKCPHFDAWLTRLESRL